MIISGFLQSITKFWRPDDKQFLATETDQKTNDIAPERIKRSPGRMNLSELLDKKGEDKLSPSFSKGRNLAQLTEEPDWYHD